MCIMTVGTNLAKNVFAAHGVYGNETPALVKSKVSRDQLLPCLIGMEACSGAHH